MKFDEIINIIFLNKKKYKIISDKDKNDAFYIINKKFSIKYPKIAKFFNNKNIDKASSIDMWFFHFKNINYIPNWYWLKTPFKKDKKNKLSGSDTKKIIEEFDLSDDEFNFLYDNYKDEIEFELKLIKRWEKNKS